MQHTLIFDESSYYIIPTFDLEETIANDEFQAIEVIKQSNDFDELSELCDELNEKMYE